MRMVTTESNTHLGDHQYVFWCLVCHSVGYIKNGDYGEKIHTVEILGKCSCVSFATPCVRSGTETMESKYTVEVLGMCSGVSFAFP